ncbi:hypothetical protein METBIDRAFT_77789 [Metschnikowia bicuspidata var. bicuspidata NRRL YB-4993]|uniref:Uncharacterized protein n=1 Tax=Metschnikowia bicuspidata var. bicuspidata NRRL YB-4993 TaxID=869754 RepID=A0A1A0HEF1_9ASCO|nr:hypothetical protein METBIDRAFT_77789 [Metschnikowia bicuspidata var. bicuspidata NRRL YB-4993]OBA22371.1 hypothetical protein METBIDRAFT_77789 [Metschnikowia bicuspidata var. bicuspidata NRRL YB-4993]
MTPDAPALGDTYTLMELPRTPDLALSQRVVVAEAQRGKRFAASDALDVGISKLLIASYVLTPTPKLVWLYPLSPATMVTSMDVQATGPGLQMYAVGLSARGKCRLLLVHKTGSETTGSAEVRLPRAAVAVKFAPGSALYVLLANGEFMLADWAHRRRHRQDHSPRGKRLRHGTKPGPARFHTFIPKGLFHHPNDLLLYAVRTPGLAAVTFRLVALSLARSFEVYQVALSGPVPPLLHACTYAQGMLYVYDHGSLSISLRSLMRPHEPVAHMPVAALVPGARAKTLVSLAAVAADRLLLAYKLLVFLVNFRFHSLLAEHTNHLGNSVYLAFALPAAAGPAQPARSFALYLNVEDSSKICKLKLIQVDAGASTLSECLGKSLAPPAPARWSGVPLLGAPDLPAAASADAAHLQAVYSKLARAQAKGQTDNFDHVLVGFLKNGPGPRKPKPMLRYAAATDRVVDHRFVEQAVALVFALADDGSLQMAAAGFLPRGAVAYLLSHPLFPAKYTRGLLVLLSALDESALLRHAIDHCAALPLAELVTELANLVDVCGELAPDAHDDLRFVSGFLQATVDRVLRDHALPQITAQLRVVLSADADADHAKVERMLHVLLDVNTTGAWTLVQAVVDVGGLFNWAVPTILALAGVVDAKLAALSVNSHNLTLATQALLALDLSQPRKGRRHEPQVVDNIHEVSSRRAQLDALLTMSNNTTNRRLLADEDVELAKQIPTYSREKLIF